MPRKKVTKPELPTELHQDTRAQWSDRLQRWCESDLSLEAFAQQEGVPTATLEWWLCRLRVDRKLAVRLAEDQPEVAMASAEAGSAPSVPFVELELDEDESVDGTRPNDVSDKTMSSGLVSNAVAVDRVEVVLRNGRLLRVSSTCDPRWVAQIADALEDIR